MYPEEVITITKKGKREVRNLIDHGKFVRYNYLDVSTGKQAERKMKIVLRNDKGEEEEYFIFPTKDKNKFLMIKVENKGPRKLWNGREAVDIDDLLS